jgi:uncharacterized protein (DUF4415 family)
MSGSKRVSRTVWVDQDDAPALTDAYFERADEFRGTTLVHKGRPLEQGPLKQPTTIRFDADVLEALRASGDGWQTRVSDAVRDLVKAGKL